MSKLLVPSALSLLVLCLMGGSNQAQAQYGRGLGYCPGPANSLSYSYVPRASYYVSPGVGISRTYSTFRGLPSAYTTYRPGYRTVVVPSAYPSYRAYGLGGYGNLGYPSPYGRALNTGPGVQLRIGF